MAEAGSLLNAPDAYMDKIALGGNYPDDIVDLDATPEENVKAVATAKGVGVDLINVCILDRPRHADMIAQVRECGARVTLITDGDIAGVIHTTDPSTGIDLYMGTGGAPEGVLAAAALRCTGGQMQGRLVLNGDDQKSVPAKWELPISTVNTKSMKWPRAMSFCLPRVLHRGQCFRVYRIKMALSGQKPCSCAHRPAPFAG